MNDDIRKKIAMEVIQAVDSLNKAVSTAGGASFDFERMAEMTLFDFIWRVAGPNKIRFYFMDKDEEEDDAEKEPKDDELFMGGNLAQRLLGPRPEPEIPPEPQPEPEHTTFSGEQI